MVQPDGPRTPACTATSCSSQASGVSKAYGAVQALRDASLAVRPGEVHALLGANGAGKSTLVKILTGVVRPDAGRILVRGQERQVHSPLEARRSGLVPVYQEPALIPDLDVRANLRLTRTPLDAFIERMRALGVARSTPRHRRGPAAGHAPHHGPGASHGRRTGRPAPRRDRPRPCPPTWPSRVLAEVGRYRDTGRSVIFISHRLLEVNALCDRATVLRDGETVGVVDMSPGAEHRIVELMLGPASDDQDADIHRRVVVGRLRRVGTARRSWPAPRPPRRSAT